MTTKNSTSAERVATYLGARRQVTSVDHITETYSSPLYASDLRELLTENARLQEICAACYAGLGGVFNLPDRFLDVLCDPEAATQEKIDSLLPVEDDESRLKATVQPEVEPFCYIVRSTCRYGASSSIFRQRVFKSEHDQDQCARQWYEHFKAQGLNMGDSRDSAWWEISKHTVYELKEDSSK